MFKRYAYKKIFSRLTEPRKFIQALSGPRQVGKTTLIQQVMKDIGIPGHYVSADAVSAASPVWLQQQWETARIKHKSNLHKKGFILVIDEIQKIPGWSNTVKLLWDQDTGNHINIKVVLLGSAPLLVQKGLTESLAGRFEMFRIPHWSYSEIRDAFGFSPEQFIYFGGYPGAAGLITDENRWRHYIRDSLIETTISKDIFMMTRVDKPALLRNLFEIGCSYSGQIVSLNKMLGQLHDAGNVTTLSHYLDLLAGAGMITGLQKYSPKKIAEKASSPKLQVLNTALITAQTDTGFEKTRLDGERWGRLVESAIGAHLINITQGTDVAVLYWRDRNREVDFVLKKVKELIAVEVKSGAGKTSLPGMEAFSKNYRAKKLLLVGGGGIGVDEFLGMDFEQIEELF
ncbi:MAG: ATP-binding protein [Nitrospirae bacterium]|nr:ATP-binding protein [Nitrospirota bacterium]